MSLYPALGDSIDEQLAINIAEQEHVKSNASLTLVQLYQTTADKEELFTSLLSMASEQHL